MDEFELPMSYILGGWMNLSYQCHIHMEDERNYVKLHKFYIQANKKLLGVKHIKLHKIKLLQDTSRYEKSKKEPKIYWATNFFNRSYISNHIVILLSNIYLAHSKIFLFQFLGRMSILPPHPTTKPDFTIFVHYRLSLD